MTKPEMTEYREYVSAQLSELSPLLQNYALGDFSENIQIPEEEDEFTELLVGLSLMVDDIREMMQEQADTIAKLQQAEKALRESETRYRTLFENVTVAVYRTAPGTEGKFLMANPTSLKMFGLDSAEEFKKMSVADVYMNPEERKRFSNNVVTQKSVTEVELLLKKGANPNLQSTDYLRTPLHDAVSMGEVATVTLLLQHRADPNIQDKFGLTPLYIAVGRSNTTIVTLLLNQRANPNVKDKQVGNSPLHVAAQNGQAQEESERKAKQPVSEVRPRVGGFASSQECAEHVAQDANLRAS